MITTKNYIWPVVRNLITGVGGFLVQVLLAFAFGGVVIATITFLRWFSLVPFAIAALCYYIWKEAQLAYKIDKDMLETKISDKLDYLRQLPLYWNIKDSEEARNKQYKEKTGEFINLMEEYKKSYGESKFYKEHLDSWNYIDKYVRDAVTKGTF